MTLFIFIVWISFITLSYRKVCKVIGVIPPGNQTPKSPTPKSPTVKSPVGSSLLPITINGDDEPAAASEKK